MPETLVGTVTHYYGHIGVAGIDVTKPLEVGDTIHLHGATTDFVQPVESIQIDHDAVEHVDPGAQIGLRVRDRVREHDQVFKVD
ncbi:MAG: translation elongation factor-like protein [Actinobacteria bacterium RBG_16_68_21]|nr:MAG: translation elongation factor-like protein [Actinobacteria bacterium RBG_16_68_21]